MEYVKARNCPKIQKIKKDIYYLLRFLALLIYYFDDLVQDCNNSIANALESLRSCTKP